MLAAPIQTTRLESGKGLFSSRRECCSRRMHNRGSLATVHDLHTPFLQLDCLAEGTSFRNGLESSAPVWNFTPPRSFESRTAVDPVTSWALSSRIYKTEERNAEAVWAPFLSPESDRDSQPWVWMGLCISQRPSGCKWQKPSSGWFIHIRKRIFRLTWL